MYAQIAVILRVQTVLVHKVNPALRVIPYHIKSGIGSSIGFGIDTAGHKHILGYRKVKRVERIGHIIVVEQRKVSFQLKLVKARGKRVSHDLLDWLTINQNIILFSILAVVFINGIRRLTAKGKQQRSRHGIIRRIEEGVLSRHLAAVCQIGVQIGIIIVRKLLYIKGQQFLFHDNGRTTVPHNSTGRVHALPLCLRRVG